MLSKIFPFLRKSELINSVPIDVSPVEYSLDSNWEEVEGLLEGRSLLIDGTGRIFISAPYGRWERADEIKDGRINIHH